LLPRRGGKGEQETPLSYEERGWGRGHTKLANTLNIYATTTPQHQPPNLCYHPATNRQIPKIKSSRILNWEKWHNVLWVHIQGLGGYFVSYRQLEQWVAACRTLIYFCANLPTLNALWSIILQEAERYTEEALSRLEVIWQQRYDYLSSRQQN
jgi:hypothetical protein